MCLATTTTTKHTMTSSSSFSCLLSEKRRAIKQKTNLKPLIFSTLILFLHSNNFTLSKAFPMLLTTQLQWRQRLRLRQQQHPVCLPLPPTPALVAATRARSVLLETLQP